MQTRSLLLMGYKPKLVSWLKSLMASAQLNCTVQRPHLYHPSQQAAEGLLETLHLSAKVSTSCILALSGT